MDAFQEAFPFLNGLFAVICVFTALIVFSSCSQHWPSFLVFLINSALMFPCLTAFVVEVPAIDHSLSQSPKLGFLNHSIATVKASGCA